MDAHAPALVGPGLNPVQPNRMVRFGMFTFLASEAMLFAGLIGGYVVLRLSNPNYFPAGKELPVLQTAIATVVLLASSATCVFAERNARAHKRPTWWLFITILLGTAFLINQAVEWTHLYHEGVWFNTYGTFASNFFTLTGFHGLHVLIGVLLLVASWLLSMAGKFDGSNHNFLDCAALYWHFVDIVWVVVFTIIYLI